MDYYNDHEPFCCEWTQNLINAGLIPGGRVDGRPIQEVEAGELAAHANCNFFNGIAGWPLALRLADVRGLGSVWTASLPCQPFSNAGKRRGKDDERHLWPVFFALLRQRRPDFAFGEQVASKSGYEWLDGVRADLESEGYAFSAADLPAACVGAPHLRHRLFWGAVRLAEPAGRRRGKGEQAGDTRREQLDAAGRRVPGGVADAGHQTGSTKQRKQQGERAEIATGSGRVGGVAFVSRLGDGHVEGPQVLRDDQAPQERGKKGGRKERPSAETGPSDRMGQPHGRRPHEGEALPRRPAAEPGVPVPHDRPWDRFAVIECTDGKYRRVAPEPELFPLAHGLPVKLELLLARLGSVGVSPDEIKRLARLARRNRKGRIKGAGNAIVPQVAAAFVRAFVESVSELRERGAAF